MEIDMENVQTLWMAVTHAGKHPLVAYSKGGHRMMDAPHHVAHPALYRSMIELAQGGQDSPVSCEAVAVASSVPGLQEATGGAFPSDTLLTFRLVKRGGYAHDITAIITPAVRRFPAYKYACKSTTP